MSGNIPEELISQIKERINIIDVVSDFLPLKKVGVNYKGLCPFHSEKTPSFTVNEEKQIFHCFGCGAGGNAITFLMKAGGMTFPDAVTELAKKAGVSIPKDDWNISSAKNDKRSGLFEVNEAAASFYHRALKDSDKGRGYLEKRGLTEDIVNDYKLGYGGDGWDSLYVFLSKKKASLTMAEELGLIIPKKSGGYYDRFRGRIIFPIFDIHGQVIGFGGRSIDGSEPKYLNSSESALFKKSDSLYGLTVAKKWIKEADEALIVEGYMDLLSLHQAGIKNSVATLGTALTAGHLRLIKRLTENIVTVFDADKAGVKATLRALDLFLTEGVRARVLSMPEGHDPDTFVRETGADRFRKEIKSARPLMEFFINEALKGKNAEEIQGKLKVVDEVLPYIERLPSKIEQGHYLKIVSERIGVNEELLFKEMRKRGGSAPKKFDVKLQKGVNPAVTLTAEKKVIQMAIRYPELMEKVIDSGVLSDFQDERLRLFGEGLFAAPAGVDLVEYFEDEEDRGVYLKLVMEMLETDEPEKELDDCIKSLRLHKLRKDKERLRKEMEEAAKKGDEDLLMELRGRHRQLK
ncbi:MAG: DNA primase [Deltaproteobacteria bacterium]|nr:DNA primase [Deltaproteobacteria bacterium]